MRKFQYSILLVLLLACLACTYLFMQIKEEEDKLETVQNNYYELEALIAQIPQKQERKNHSTSLFSRFNSIAQELNLTQNIIRVQPLTVSHGNYQEKIEMEFSGLYLNQCIACIGKWTLFPDVQIEQTNISKNSNNLFTLSMSVLRYADQ